MRIPIAIVVALGLILGGVGSAFAYEGGTKAVATLTYPERGKQAYRPLSVISHNALDPGKLAVQFLRRAPKPTLSATQLREEKLGYSSGTKALVRFWKGGRV